MRLHEIGQFYGERKGWRMFDSRALTPEITRYLKAEALFLERAMKTSGYRTLIEVGCGYGRYLDWSLSRSYNYLGMDIVQWMVELGKLRSKKARKKYPELSCSIIRHAAEEISRAIKELSIDHPENKALIFFPFNCMGNVASFEKVIDSLKETGLDIVVSTFRTDAISTKVRKEYYSNCGYEQLNSRILKHGLLIISEEGFHAMAYHQDVLVNAFSRRGFELAAQESSNGPGNILFFTRSNKRETSLSKTDNSARDRSANVEACIHILLDDPLSDSKNEESGAELLSFEEIQITLKAISTDLYRAESPVEIAVGTSLRLVLPVEPPAASKAEEGLWYTDLVGEVSACVKKDTGSFELLLNLAGQEQAATNNNEYDK